MKITPEIEIEDWELTEQFIRASGPGGQNVNKVSSAVELRFEASRSPNLTDAVKSRLKRLAGRRWTKDGAIVLQVDETRSQARNRELARERLATLIRQATNHRGQRRIFIVSHPSNPNPLSLFTKQQALRKHTKHIKTCARMTSKCH